MNYPINPHLTLCKVNSGCNDYIRRRVLEKTTSCQYKPIKKGLNSFNPVIMRFLVAGTVAAVASAGVVSPVEEKLFTDFQGKFSLVIPEIHFFQLTILMVTWLTSKTPMKVVSPSL